MNITDIDLQLFADDDWDDIEVDTAYGEDTNTEELDFDTHNITTEQVDTATPADNITDEGIPAEVLHRLRVNHNDEDVTYDELIRRAQKGTNYDKIQAKLSTLESSKGLAYIEKLAKLNDRTVDEMVQLWQEADEREQVEDIADRESVTPEFAQRLYNAERESKEAKSLLSVAEQTKLDAQAREKEYSDFATEFPEVSSESVPPEVWQYREKTGRDLVSSMHWYENQAAKTETKRLRQLVENDKKVPGVGGVTNFGSTKPVDDDFDAGFNSR